MHYCMGKFVSLNFMDSKSCPKCGECEMKMKKGCCDEKEIVIKTEKQYNTIQSFLNLYKSATYLTPFSSQDVLAGSITHITISHLPSDALRRTCKLPLFIRNNIFRI